MSLVFNQKITLDLTISRVQNVHCSQDDADSRNILITLSDNGKSYNIPSEVRIFLKISKPDNTYVYIDEDDADHLFRNDDGTISIILSEQATCVPGICEAELQFITPKETISTRKFNIIVKKSVINDEEIESVIESNIIQKMIRHLIDFMNPHKVNKEQVGLGNVPNVTTNDQTPTYEEAEEFENISSGEKLSIAFGKIQKAISSLLGHINNFDNPHKTTKSQIQLGNVDNTSDVDKPVSTAQQKAIDGAYANSNKYTDQKIADLINGAPETMDTLKEVADAIEKNKSVVEALDKSIGTKANQNELDTHTGNDTIHITSDERTKWNDANNKKHSHNNKSVLDGITSELVQKWTETSSSSVTGIKGVNEDSFRRGNVVLTAKDVGAYDKDTLDKKLNDVQATKLWIKRLETSDANDNPTTAVCQSVFYEYPPDSLNIPDANWYHILTSQSADAFCRTQFALSMTGAPNLAFRNFVGGSWNSWRNVLTTAGGTITGNISTNGGATFATDGNVYLNSNGYKDWLTNILNSKLSTSASCNKNWNWVGKGGQPTWLWGGELSNDVYVYNPSNFSVAYARDTAGVIAGAGDVRVGFSGDGVNFRTYNKAGTAAVNGHTNLGSGSYRWKQLFATTATISTSDRNLKKDIYQLTDTHLDFFLKLQPVSFLFKDGESGRTHIGFIAQDVEQAMSECGLTDLDFAGFCKDQKVEVFFEEDENGDKIEKERPILDENGNPDYIYSLRYEEFIALNTYVIQKLWKRVDAVEKENIETKNQIKSMQQDIAELKKSRT